MINLFQPTLGDAEVEAIREVFGAGRMPHILFRAESSGGDFSGKLLW